MDVYSDGLNYFICPLLRCLPDTLSKFDISWIKTMKNNIYKGVSGLNINFVFFPGINWPFKFLRL